MKADRLGDAIDDVDRAYPGFFSCLEVIGQFIGIGIITYSIWTADGVSQETYNKAILTLLFVLVLCRKR